MENCTAEFERPTDFVLILNGKDNTRLLVQDRYNPIHANYEEDITGEDPYIDPPARDSAVSVSYTHLDVYKRQDPLLLRVLQFDGRRPLPRVPR